jgi:hypothetical protein
MTYNADLDRENRPEPKDPRIDFPEMTESFWFSFNATRAQRDLEYEAWCAVHTLDPEDVESAVVYERSGAAHSMDRDFWFEQGYA